MKINVTKKKEKNRGFKKQIDKLRNDDNKIAKFLIHYYDFYNQELYRKHMVLYIISLFIFFVMIVYYIRLNGTTSDLAKSIETASQNVPLGKIANLKVIFTDKLLLNLVLLISGVTPYIYIPVIGVAYSANLALDIIALYNNVASNMNVIFVTIGSFVQMFGVTLTSAIGMYYCSYSTKRFKYSQKMNFTLNDVKKEIYKIKKNDKKLEEVTKNEDRRKEKIEKLNVKIPYKDIISIFVISSIIIIIGGLITLL